MTVHVVHLIFIDQLAEGSRLESQRDSGSQPEVGCPRHLRRERNPPSNLNDYVIDLEDQDDQVLSSVDYCYKISAFPLTYQEAIQSPKSEKLEWCTA